MKEESKVESKEFFWFSCHSFLFAHQLVQSPRILTFDVGKYGATSARARNTWLCIKKHFPTETAIWRLCCAGEKAKLLAFFHLSNFIHLFLLWNYPKINLDNAHASIKALQKFHVYLCLISLKTASISPCQIEFSWKYKSCKFSWRFSSCLMPRRTILVFVFDS